MWEDSWWGFLFHINKHTYWVPLPTKCLTIFSRRLFFSPSPFRRGKPGEIGNLRGYRKDRGTTVWPAPPRGSMSGVWRDNGWAQAMTRAASRGPPGIWWPRFSQHSAGALLSSFFHLDFLDFQLTMWVGLVRSVGTHHGPALAFDAGLARIISISNQCAGGHWAVRQFAKPPGGSSCPLPQHPQFQVGLSGIRRPSDWSKPDGKGTEPQMPFLWPLPKPFHSPLFLSSSFFFFFSLLVNPRPLQRCVSMLRTERQHSRKRLLSFNLSAKAYEKFGEIASLQAI